MNQLDDLSRLCRAARRGEDPSPEDFGAVRRGVAARVGLGVIAGAASVSKAGAAIAGTAPASLAGIGVAAKTSLISSVVVWILGGGALGGVTVWLAADAPSARSVASAPARPAPAETLRRADGLAVPPRAATPETPSPTPARDPAPSAPAATVRRAEPVSEAASEAASPAPAPSPPRLGEEARALAEVQRALRDGRPEPALELLEDMDARFGDSPLATERMAARVLSLCAAGRVEAARALAQRFIAAHPGSPLIGRIRSACAP